jgi:hypothetical protein
MEDSQENVRNVLNLLEMDFGLMDNRTRPTNHYTNRNYIRNQQRNSRGIYRQNNERPQIINDYLQNIGQYTNVAEPIGFTNAEIELATTEMQFNSLLTQIQCPISLDFFQQGQDVLCINGCGHMFSKPGLTQWFRNHRQCPVCRGRPVMVTRAITTDVEQPENQNNNNAMSSLITGIVAGVAANALTSEDGYYEQEFTLALRDLVNLSSLRDASDCST